MTRRGCLSPRQAASAAAHMIVISITLGVALGTVELPKYSLTASAKEAGVIFAGTVTRMVSEMHPSGHYAITRVTFKNLDLVKGSAPGDSIVLTLRGGKVGKHYFETVGQPEFEDSRRYILLVKADLGSVSNGFHPIVGLSRGFFPVGNGPTRDGRPVLDRRYRPLARVTNGRIVVVDASRSDSLDDELRAESWDRDGTPTVEVLAARKDPGTRVSEAEFLMALRSLVGR